MFYSEIVINEHYSGFNPVRFGHEDCAPNHFFGPAVKTRWVLHYVVSGQGIFKIRGNVYTLHAGDLFVIPPYEETFYQADSKNPWHYIWIGFSSDESIPDIFQQSVFHAPYAKIIFNEMKQCKNMDNGKSAYLCSCLWRLVSSLLEHTEPVASPIDKAINYMHSEYFYPITISDIANHLNLDRSYFSSLFKKQMGISPKDYLTDLRLSKAADLMITHGQTPSVAAASVGYPDVFQFSKIFKKKYGVSPRAYIATNK